MIYTSQSMLTYDKHIICETSLVLGTYGGDHIYSTINKTLDMDNGMLMKIAQPTDGESELYDVALPAQGDKLVLICGPEVIKDARTKLDEQLDRFYTPAGRTVRAYELRIHDKITVSDYAITPISSESGVQVGNYVVADPATGKYKEVAKGSDMSSYGFYALIKEPVYKTYGKSFRYIVMKNETVA